MEITCGVIFFQECFYQCSPYVYKYAIPNVKGAITGKEIACVCKLLLFWLLANCFVSGSAAHQLNGCVSREI